MEFNYVTHEALPLEAFKSNIVAYMLGVSAFRYIIQVSQPYLHATELLNENSALADQDGPPNSSFLVRYPT